MSASADSEQFFPPLLKWISLSFFAVIFILFAISIYTSPQSMAPMQAQTESVATPHPLTQPSQVATASASYQAEALSKVDTNSSPSNGTASQHSPNTNQAPVTPAPTNTAPAPPEVKSAVDGCKMGEVKGISVSGQKFYYEMGRQKYYVIDRQPGIKLISCFHSATDAIKNGFEKAPDFSILMTLIRRIGL